MLCCQVDSGFLPCPRAHRRVPASPASRGDDGRAHRCISECTDSAPGELIGSWERLVLAFFQVSAALSTALPSPRRTGGGHRRHHGGRGPVPAGHAQDTPAELGRVLGRRWLHETLCWNPSCHNSLSTCRSARQHGASVTPSHTHQLSLPPSLSCNLLLHLRADQGSGRSPPAHSTGTYAGCISRRIGGYEFCAHQHIYSLVTIPPSSLSKGLLHCAGTLRGGEAASSGKPHPPSFPHH